MHFAASSRAGGAANDHLGPAVASGRLSSKEQAEEVFTKALLAVASHLKSPKKVPNGLFNAGLAIVLVALADSPTSLKCQQLQLSSGADRGRAAIGIVSKWASEMCKRKKKSEVALALLRKAENASSANKAILLRCFGLVRNPVSICRALEIVVKALVKALTNAEAVTKDSSNETNAATTDGLVLPVSFLPAGGTLMTRQGERSKAQSTATNGLILPVSKLSALPAGETLILRRKEPFQTKSTVDKRTGQQARMSGTAGTSTVTECAGAREGGTGSGTVVIAATQVIGDVSAVVGVGSVERTTHDKVATPGGKGAAADVAANEDNSPHSGASRKRSLQLPREVKCEVGTGTKAERGADRKAVAIDYEPSVSVDGTSHDQAATPSDSGVAVDVATNLGGSPHCGANGICSLQITRENKCEGGRGFKTEGGADRKFIAVDSKPTVSDGGTSHDKTATPGDKGAAIKKAKDWNSSPDCGASGTRPLQLTQGKGGKGTQGGTDRQAVATVSQPIIAIARPPAKVSLGQPPRGSPLCATKGVVDRRQQDPLGEPAVTAGAVLKERDRCRDEIQPNDVADKTARPLTLEWRVRSGDNSARPPALEWRVGCGGGVGGSRKSEMQKKLADVKLEVADGRSAVVRAGKLCAWAPTPLIELQETMFKRFKCQMKKAIAGRAMANLLFNREQQLRKDETDRYMVELKEARDLAESRRKKNCAYESTLEEMRVKLASAEDELRKSRHLISTLQEELGVRGMPTSPPATSVLLPGSERSEIGDDSNEDESYSDGSNEDDSSEDDTDGDDSDDGEARADSGLPQHIMDTWASCSSSSSSCASSTSDASSEFSEDSDVDGVVNLCSEEFRVLSARREMLHQAEGVGFMASLADMKKGVATKGRKIGGGGSGEVFELEVVDRNLQEELLSFTVGAGVVLKKFNKTQEGENSAFREIRALSSLMPLCHPNIVNVFSTNIAKRTLVMERVSRDLQALLENPRLLSEVSGEQMVGLCLGAARGLAYMHDRLLVHGDIKPENIVVSDDLRSVKLIDFGSTGKSHTDKVEAMTMPYAAPEAMCFMNHEVVPLDESMDVWSMAIVIIQAITRRTTGPTEGDVLSHHYDVLCPPETAEAFRVAETNIETLHAREYDTNSKADKLALGEARWRLERMLNIHAGMRAKMSPPDEYMLSPRVWKEQWGLAHLGEVRKILAVMLNSDPRSRIPMKTVVHALERPELWMENVELKKAMKTFGTGISDEAVTEAMRMNHRNAIASKIVKPLSRDVLALLACINNANDGEELAGPSWSELGGEDGNTWWTKVPSVTALV